MGSTHQHIEPAHEAGHATDGQNHPHRLPVNRLHQMHLQRLHLAAHLLDFEVNLVDLFGEFELGFRQVRARDLLRQVRIAFFQLRERLGNDPRPFVRRLRRPVIPVSAARSFPFPRWLFSILRHVQTCRQGAFHLPLRARARSP